MYIQKHPVKKNAELTLKERALFTPRFPNSYFLFHETHSPSEVADKYPEIGDMPLCVFVKHYSIADLKRWSYVGPVTKKILSKIFKEAGLSWK